MAASSAAQQLEFGRIFSKIDGFVLPDYAASLRHGIECHIAPLTSEGDIFMGGTNFHISIEVGYGVVWLARIGRRNARNSPQYTEERVLVSDVETIVGVSCIILEKMNGRLYTHLQPTLDQKQKLMEQLARMYSLLADFAFVFIGCLTKDWKWQK